jgi:hypothetical protein
VKATLSDSSSLIDRPVTADPPAEKDATSAERERASLILRDEGRPYAREAHH